MATGTIETSRGFCPTCKTHTKVERNSMVWGCGDVVMVLFSCGLWVLGRILLRPAWRCSQCGSKARV